MILLKRSRPFSGVLAQHHGHKEHFENSPEFFSFGSLLELAWGGLIVSGATQLGHLQVMRTTSTESVLDAVFRI